MLNKFPDAVPQLHAHALSSSRATLKKSSPKVLIVDDESLIRYSVKKFVEGEGFLSVTADSGVHAIRHFEETQPEIVILDIRLPDTNGLTLLKAFKEAAPQTAVIMITACADIRSTVEAMKLGAADYLEKPIDFDKLAELLKTIKSNSIPPAKTFSNGGFVVTSETMKEIIRITELLATKSDLTALVLGESGTGKSCLCKLMHELSPRKEKAFVEIGCSNIPEHLIESELFGYEKGAFTDAKAPKKGLVEMANGGTIFFDEIGDMPYPMQAKLLSLIEEKRFRRVGGLQHINADVRIFAATNRNLDELVQARKFRLDLYYRLNVATIDMPPLRERREDIAALIQYYLKLNSDKYGCAPKKISDKAMQFLREHPWPGNIRELKNLIEKLVILSKGELIDLDDLPSEIFSRKAQPFAGYAPESAVRADEDNGGRAGDLSLRSMEVEYIRKALKLSEGNQRKAAKLLNISRDTLRYRLKKLGIDSSHYLSDC